MPQGFGGELAAETSFRRKARDLSTARSPRLCGADAPPSLAFFSGNKTKRFLLASAPASSNVLAAPTDRTGPDPAVLCLRCDAKCQMEMAPTKQKAGHAFFFSASTARTHTHTHTSARSGSLALASSPRPGRGSVGVVVVSLTSPRQPAAAFIYFINRPPRRLAGLRQAQ